MTSKDQQDSMPEEELILCPSCLDLIPGDRICVDPNNCSLGNNDLISIKQTKRINRYLEHVTKIRLSTEVVSKEDHETLKTAVRDTLKHLYGSEAALRAKAKLQKLIGDETDG